MGSTLLGAERQREQRSKKYSIVIKERKPLKTTYPIHNAPLQSELPASSTFNGIHFHTKKKSCCRPHLVFRHTYPAQQPAFLKRFTGRLTLRIQTGSNSKCDHSDLTGLCPTVPTQFQSFCFLINGTSTF